MSSAIPQFYSSAILKTTKNNINETSCWVLQFRNSAVLQFNKQQKVILMRIRIEFSFRNSTNIKKLYSMRLRIEFCSSAILQFYILQKSIFKETLQIRNSTNCKKKKYLKRLHNEFCNSAVLQSYNSTNHKTHNMV